MRRSVYYVIGAVFAGIGVVLACAAMPSSDNAEAPGDRAMSREYTVACYYFPNYHPDARNAKRHGPGWTEWELVKAAKPRFEGHRQPKIPLWGYGDESDPEVMAQKIDAAADHGVDVFIFDWYWYDDGPFLERGLDEGFLKASNNDRLKFALMWANHDWIDIHPAKLDETPELLYPGTVTPETFDRICDQVIEHYFKHPSHWKIDGRPYFSIYELHTFVKSFGSLDAARAALERFREKTVAAGFPGLHLNAVAFGIQILPGETVVKNPEELVRYTGFDSVTSYVWIHHVALPEFPQTPYDDVMEKAVAHWEQATMQFGVPYHPNVTMGWDSSPRCRQSDPFENRGYPFMAGLSGNTPEAFKRALESVKAFLDRQEEGPRIFTVNCWNEWTEGSYLEPDTEDGFAYLKALQDVFPPK
jgi:hypothetical protein